MSSLCRCSPSVLQFLLRLWGFSPWSFAAAAAGTWGVSRGVSCAWVCSWPWWVGPRKRTGPPWLPGRQRREWSGPPPGCSDQALFLKTGWEGEGSKVRGDGYFVNPIKVLQRLSDSVLHFKPHFKGFLTQTCKESDKQPIASKKCSLVFKGKQQGMAIY